MYSLCTLFPSLSTPYVSYLFSDIRPLVCPVTYDLISDSEYGIPDESLTASSGKTFLHCKNYKTWIGRTVPVAWLQMRLKFRLFFFGFLSGCKLCDQLFWVAFMSISSRLHWSKTTILRTNSCKVLVKFRSNEKKHMTKIALFFLNGIAALDLFSTFSSF